MVLTSLLFGIVTIALSCSIRHGQGQELVSTNLPGEPTESSGVSTTMSQQECKSSFEGYDGYYLQGVKEDSFVTYNDTSFDDCMMLCCKFDKFKCESFSYLSILRVCYIMNVTERHHRAKMLKGHFWHHYHRPGTTDNTTAAPEPATPSENPTPTPLADLETTPKISTNPTKTTTTSTSQDTAANVIATASSTRVTEEPVPVIKTTPTSRLTHSSKEQLRSTSPGTGGDIDASAKPAQPIGNLTATENPNFAPDTTKAEAEASNILASMGSRAARGQTTTPLHVMCPQSCKNGGVCKLYSPKEGEKSPHESPKAVCKCKAGFEGNFCEKEALAKAKVPSYVIAVAVLGSIILILFLTLLIIYATYRSRTGKYRVREQRERWTKSAQARRTQSFNSILGRSPVGSELSVPGSVNSSFTRSTATTV